MKILFSFILLIGSFSSGAFAAKVTTTPHGQITVNQLDLALSDADLDCDADYFECKYRIQGFKFDSTLRGLNWSGKPTRDWPATYLIPLEAKFEGTSARKCEARVDLRRVKTSSSAELVFQTCCRANSESACFDSGKDILQLGLAALPNPLKIDVVTVKEF